MCPPPPPPPVTPGACMARALPDPARTPGGAAWTARSIELRRGVPDPTGAAMAGSAATTRARGGTLVASWHS